MSYPPAGPRNHVTNAAPPSGERARPPGPGRENTAVTPSAGHPGYPGRGLRPCRYQRGIALVLVLWITILLTVIAGGFAYSMHTEALATRNAVSVAQARAIADGAVQATAFELLRPRGPTGLWAPDGQLHIWNEAGALIAASAVDESGKIDLNTASEALLKALLQTAGGLDADAAGRLLDAIQDWKDPDDLTRPNGAEAADYKAAGLTYAPANGPFEMVVELQRVLGMTPALYARIADSLTVHSRQPGINPVYASRAVLLSLPGATAEVVDTYITQRADALKANQPAPLFPLGGPSGPPTQVWRIRAEVTMPDGVMFAREAVLKPDAQGRQPPTVLFWQEADRRALAEPNAH